MEIDDRIGEEMRKTLVLIGLQALILIGGTAAVAFAQPDPSCTAATATATAQVNIIPPISLRMFRGLNFGTVGAGTGGGSVVMSATGIRSAQGDVSLSQNSPAFQAAFSLSGESGATYVLLLPNTVNLSLAASGDRGGSSTVCLDTFTASPGIRGVLSAGHQILNVGATLRIPPRVAYGVYYGLFDVTAAYN